MIAHIDLDGLADSARRAETWRTMRHAGLIIVLGAAGFLVAECGNVAEAQEMDPATELARMCWGETAATALDECTAMAAVLARRSGTGEVTVDIARRYSSALRGHSRHVRPWLLELDAAGRRPPSWPQRLRWAAWRPRWLALLDHARRIVAGGVASACSPDHWGGAMDSHRARRAGWVPVDCGRTRNRFWRVPRS